MLSFNPPMLWSSLITAAALIHLAGALDAGCAPGGNFDLSVWNLQLPIGSTGRPTTKSFNEIQGCGGWQSSAYFYTDAADGALVMKVPGSPSSAGCVTTPNSKHCRTELREIFPSSWDPWAGYNRLTATLSVPQPDDTDRGTCVGQIHIDDAISSKPVCELFYNANGRLRMGVVQTRAGADMLFTDIAWVPVGQVFTYEIRYESNVLSVVITYQNTVTGPVMLSTYNLNAPLSYFKAGNYNQGDTPSVVRFHAISVRHGSTPPSTPSTPSLVSSVILPGIGPSNMVYALSGPEAAVPPPTGACDASPPVKKNDDTVTVKLFYEQDCCHAIETSSIGRWNTCHDSNKPFTAVKQAVGGNLWDRGIKIFAFAERGCLGRQYPSSSGISLSNVDVCRQAGSIGSQQFLSYMIFEPPECDIATTNDSPNTVSLELYSDFGCCTVNQKYKIGTLDTCHTASKPFHGISQAVGGNMFGWLYHIHPFTGADCTGAAGEVLSLSNRDVCYKSGPAYNSFRLAQTCNYIKPVNPSDTTVTLALFRDSACCVPTQEKITVGTIDKCHTMDERFSSISQSVGQGMFNRDIRIQVFTGEGCTGTMRQRTLTNANSCDLESASASEYYTSFRLHIPCGWHIPEKKNENTATLALYSDTKCCSAISDTVVGTIGECKTLPSSVGGINVVAGSSLISSSIWILTYTNADCSGDFNNGWVLSSSLQNSCLTTMNSQPHFRSYKLVRPSIPTKPPDPTPVPTPADPTPTPTPEPAPPSLGPIQHPWYCLGVREFWTLSSLNSYGQSIHSYAYTARNMNAGTAEDTGYSGFRKATRDMCWKTIGGAVVQCWGDIEQQCSGYGVAWYNGRNCRTRCDGDEPHCGHIPGPIAGWILPMTLVCDRSLFA